MNPGDGSSSDNAEYHAVMSSFLECELASSGENSCSIKTRVKLSTSLESKEDDLCANHLDCAGKTGNKTSESAGDQEAGAAGSERPFKKKRVRKNRRKGSEVTTNTCLKKGSRRSGVVIRMRRLSSAPELLCMCLSRRTKRNCALGDHANRRKWRSKQNEVFVICAEVGLYVFKPPDKEKK